MSDRLTFSGGAPVMDIYYCGYNSQGVCFSPTCVPDDAF